jgi:D-3-phosphoglycerate dehydrogenase
MTENGSAVNSELPVVVVALGAVSPDVPVTETFRSSATVRVADLSTPADVKAATAGADAVVVALQQLSAEHIEAMADTVRVIGRMGIGTDTVDLQTAAACGISVFNEPTYGVREVATHAVAMLLALHRRLVTCDGYVRDDWSAGKQFSVAAFQPIDEMTVGIIGCGRIGSTVAGALAPMAGEIVVYDPLLAGPAPAGATRVDQLDALLERSQAITVHGPLTAQTRGMLGRREMTLLPQGALLVNVSRGGQVDEAALASLLTAGQLGGAALDVFETEPLPAESPLLHAPNTLLSPHCAAYSGRSARRLADWTVGDAIEWIGTGKLRHGSVVVAGTR